MMIHYRQQSTCDDSSLKYSSIFEKVAASVHLILKGMFFVSSLLLHAC